MLKPFEKSLGPLSMWLTTFTIALFVSVLSLRNFLASAFEADQSNIAISIFILFIIAVTASFMHACKVSRELKYVSGMILKSPHQSDSYNWEEREVAKIMSISYLSNCPVIGLNLISPYKSRLTRNPQVINMIASILVTLGLIGTVVGLIGAISGLNTVINNVTFSEEDLLGGIKQTILSMGTAFYTTLFGAFFGGFFLKALAKTSAISVDNIICLLLEEIELNNSKIENKEANEEARVTALNQFIDQHNILMQVCHELSNSFSSLKSQTDEFSDHLRNDIESLLNARIAKLSNDIQLLAESLKTFSRH